MFFLQYISITLFSCDKTVSQDNEIPPTQEAEPPVVSQDNEPISIIGALPIFGDKEIWVETLFDEATIPYLISGTRILFHTSGEALFFDETNNTTTSLGHFDQIEGLQLDVQQSMILLDGTVFIFDGEWLEESPINDILPIPVETAEGHRDNLWLQGAGQLYWYHEGTLQSVSTENHTHLFSYGGFDSSAIATPQLRILDTSSSTLEIVDYRNDLLPTNMTYDKSGVFWVSDGSSFLYQRDTNRRWSAVEATSPILTLKSNPKHPNLWIHTEEMDILHQNGLFFRIELPEGDWRNVDEYGRLLLQTEESVVRISSSRTVAVDGIVHNEILDGMTTLTFVPSMEDSLESMHAWIDQQALDINEENQSAVDSNDFASGAHTLRIVAIGPEGESITEIPFYVGALPDVKWQDGIDPLTQAHCNDCHGEGSFLPLNTAALWQENIEIILSEVISNEMPKGGPYLNADEIQLIRGWKNGGFQ